MMKFNLGDHVAAKGSTKNCSLDHVGKITQINTEDNYYRLDNEFWYKEHQLSPITPEMTEDLSDEEKDFIYDLLILKKDLIKKDIRQDKITGEIKDYLADTLKIKSIMKKLFGEELND